MPKTEDVFTKIAELETLRKQGIRTLLKERRRIDRQLAKLNYSSDGSSRANGKPRHCKICGKTGHNSRTCPLAKVKKSA